MKTAKRCSLFAALVLAACGPTDSPPSDPNPSVCPKEVGAEEGEACLTNEDCKSCGCSVTTPRDGGEPYGQCQHDSTKDIQ